MKRLAFSVMLAATLVTVLVAPQAVAGAPDQLTTKSVPASVTVVDPPRLEESRLRPSGEGMAVDIAARVDARRLAGRDQDAAQVQVAVLSSKTGDLVVGPRQPVDVASSSLNATVELTPDQVAALREWVSVAGWGVAAGAVSVGIRHEVHVAAGRVTPDAIGLGQGSARWGGPAPRAWMGAVRGTQDVVRMQNGTSNPLVLLAGPVNCMYDSNYPLAAGSDDKTNFLAQLNGSILPAGATIATVTENSGDIQDSKYATTSNAVFAAYTSALTSAYRWFNSTSAKATLPQFPSGDSLPAGVTGTVKQLTQEVIAQATQGALAKQGALDTMYNNATTIVGGILIMAEIDVPGLDQIFAIIGDIVDVFVSGCDGQKGVFVVGATDATHPWRQFASLYQWNNGKTAIYKASGSTQYVPYANGMVANIYSETPYSSRADVSYDNLYQLMSPQGDQNIWIFSEPDYNADYPADISIKGRTISCPLDPRDARSQVQAMAAATTQGQTQVLSVWPNQVWTSLTDATKTSTTMPTNLEYVDGINFVPTNGQGYVTAFTSADGVTWSDPLISAPGSSTVTIPASSPARLVQCSVQSTEGWQNSVTTNGRHALMGTRIMSDMVVGPDAD